MNNQQTKNPQTKDPTAEILSYLKKLVSISTAYPPGDTSQVASYLKDCLASMGYTTDLYARVAGMDNIVATMGSGSPSLVFNVHVDTVDAGDLSLWAHSPLKATVEDGFVYGLGSANCKGSGAVQLWLANEIARRGGPRNGTVTFTFVTDEESLGPDGMYFLRDQGIVKPDMLLLGAPTDNSLITAERGVLWVEIITNGKPAHAGQPEDGDNAILRMMRIIDRINNEMSSRLSQRIEGDMRSTMNIGKVQGGRNTNVVPSQCIAQIDRRLLPSETVDQAFAELVSIIESVGEPKEMVSVEKFRGTDGFNGDNSGPLVSALSQAILDATGTPARYEAAIGVSDGRYFSNDGIEIVNFGPGIGSEGHASNESVSIESLTTSALILDQAFAALIGYSS
ncbi:MAG: succinyl-diaminopimelate desuccinylase [Woeseiaceae bacterium]|jgi:succinyl-diaminopimelate desuccinylase